MHLDVCVVIITGHMMVVSIGLAQTFRMHKEFYQMCVMVLATYFERIKRRVKSLQISTTDQLYVVTYWSHDVGNC